MKPSQILRREFISSVGYERDKCMRDLKAESMLLIRFVVKNIMPSKYSKIRNNTGIASIAEGKTDMSHT